MGELGLEGECTMGRWKLCKRQSRLRRREEHSFRPNATNMLRSLSSSNSIPCFLKLSFVIHSQQPSLACTKYPSIYETRFRHGALYTSNPLRYLTFRYIRAYLPKHPSKQLTWKLVLPGSLKPPNRRDFSRPEQGFGGTRGQKERSSAVFSSTVDESWCGI